jgi:radical SAM protein with 4Fe4S-binding SPASM domain
MLKLFHRFGIIPRRCTWEVTLACNLRCGHCGSRAGRARPDELTTDEAFAVADDLKTLGCQHVTLAGGEPTLRSDWPDLMERLVSQGVRVSMISNGVTWSRELTMRARERGVHRMGFSIDGLERTHDCVRRAARGYRKVLLAIDHCVEAGIPVVAVTHLTRHNLDELEELHATLGRHGVSIWQVQLGVPMGNMTEDRGSILGSEEILELIPRLARLNRAGRPPRVFGADNVGYFGDYEQELRLSGSSRIPFWVGCRAGLDVLGIESHGDVKGCLSLPSELNGRRDFVEGNVRQRSLIEIWHDPDAFAYNRRFRPEHLRGDCAGCEYGEICRGGCVWTSVSHHGHPHQFPQCFHNLSRKADEERDRRLAQGAGG